MTKKSSNDLVEQGGKVEVLPPTPRRLRIPLRTAREVQRELARLYRQMKGGEIATQDGSRLAYVLNLLRQSIEASDLESRIEALEKAKEQGLWSDE